MDDEDTGPHVAVAALVVLRALAPLLGLPRVLVYAASDAVPPRVALRIVLVAE